MPDEDLFDRLTRRLALIDRATESPIWTELILPEIQARHREHQTACCNRDLTPEKRAEHIEAVHLAEALAGLLVSKRRQTEHSIAAARNKNKPN